MLLLKGGKDMRTLYDHVGKVLADDTFDATVTKITNGLTARTNKVVQRNMLLTAFPQGSKSFEKWTLEISQAAKLISYTNYDWQQAAVDAILLQTSNTKLRERALQEELTYDNLIKLGIAKEQSSKGAALLERASGQSSHTADTMEERVRRLTIENRQLKKGRDRGSRNSNKKAECGRCGNENCKQGKQCPANGQKCSKCKKPNHFSRVCRTKMSLNCQVMKARTKTVIG